LFKWSTESKYRQFSIWQYGTEDFVQAMLESTALTMLMYGGNYLKSHEIEINLEDAFPVQFLLGSGNPNLGTKCKVDVSNKAWSRH